MALQEALGLLLYFEQKVLMEHGHNGLLQYFELEVLVGPVHEYS